MGEGVIPWPEILRAVKARGYDGWLSLEYERRWHPDDIPDASIGMKRSLEYLRGIEHDENLFQNAQQHWRECAMINQTMKIALLGVSHWHVPSICRLAGELGRGCERW